MKKILPLLCAVAALVTLGAGCAAENPGTDEGTKTTPPTTTPVAMTAQTELTATAEVKEKGTVVVRWQKPTSMPEGTIFRVLNSVNPEPTLPSAYWYERSTTNAMEAEVPNVQPGKRYFRVCEYKNNACVKYSNTVEITMP